MSNRKFLTTADLVAAVLGGAVLGGGGGGAMEDGRVLGACALESGSVELVAVETLPADAVLLTVSAVGAPAAQERYVLPEHYTRAVAYFTACFGVKPAGIITNECGGNATINGWLQAASLGIPLVDAPCNGRAHPTGIMGSVGLHLDPAYVAQQTAVGGNPATGHYLELAVSGSLAQTAALVRDASVRAGGLVTVARNPITAAYAKTHAAVGAIAQSIELGKAMLAAKKAGAPMPEAAAACLGGEIIATGVIKQLLLETRGGFDVGRVCLAVDDGELALTFWNEYMTLEKNGRRLATFPDLLATFDGDSGCPVSTAQLSEGMPIKLLCADKSCIRLGAGMRDPRLFAAAEQAVGKNLIKFAFSHTS